MKTKATAFLLTIALVLSLLTGCGGNPTEKAGKPQALALSPETTAVTTNDGITVDVGNYVLDGETELTVTKRPVEENKEEGYKIEAYDISLGDIHELNDFITIRIPYGTDFCEAGQDPARCVGAKYKNESTGEWEDVLFEVDAAANELVIYTDHLSCYGVFYVENEGKRNAYITDVLDSGLYMEDAAAYDFANRIAADDPTVTEDLAKFGIDAVGKFFDYSDRLDNAITMATVGDIPDWLDTEISGTNLTLFSAIGYVATCTNLMKVAVNDTVGGGADKGEILNLIRDVGSKVTSYWADAFTSVGSGALSVGMGGVLIIDKMLTAFAEEAQSTKLEDIAYVYHHYNEGFSGFGHKPMTAKDWRAKAIEVIDKHPDDPELAYTALEAGFREYASEFFDLSYDQQSEVAADTPLVTVKRIPDFTAAEQEKLTEDYIAHLKNDVMPGVLKSVENYMVRKVEQRQLDAINAVKDYYNTKISITISENLPEGGESAYIGYKFRFAPLDDTADVANWTGKWSGEPINTSATLMGFMTSGLPHTVEFFAPDADMNTAEPEFVVPFVISIPEINIEFGGAPVFDELVGSYADGTMTITEIYASASLREELAGGESADNEYGCDIGELLTSLEERIGVPNDSPFEITKTGEDSGFVVMDEDSELSAKYDPSAGTLSLSLVGAEEEGITLSGELRATYNSDKTGVILSGNLTTSLFFSAEDLRITIKIDGTKGLVP